MRMNTSLGLSVWARRHRSVAVVAIVILKTAIACIGLFLGAMLALDGYVLPQEIQWVLAAIAAVSLWFYPAGQDQKRLGRTLLYRRRKRMDGILTGLGFAILFFFGNVLVKWAHHPDSVGYAASTVHVSYSSLKKEPVEFRKEVIRSGKWKRWTIARVKMKTQKALAGIARVSEDASLGLQLFMSLGLIALAFLAGYGVAILSCSIACNGQEALAILVLVLGGAGVIAGLIFGFRAIWSVGGSNETDGRHQKKRPPTKTN